MFELRCSEFELSCSEFNPILCASSRSGVTGVVKSRMDFSDISYGQLKTLDDYRHSGERSLFRAAYGVGQVVWNQRMSVRVKSSCRRRFRMV